MAPATDERRRFPRIQADVLVRPVGVLGRWRARRAVDVSLGGVRSYSDEEHGRGEVLELELLTDGEEPLTMVAEVAWVESLGPDAPAAFDVGFRFVGATADQLERVRAMLERPRFAG